MRRALAGALIVLCGVPASASAQDLLTPDPPRTAIQPGMLVNTPTGSQCTGGFIFDGTGAQAGRHYLGLAAHCVDDAIGGRVADAFGQEFGTVVLSVWPYADYSEDYAFVEIDPAAYARVDPALAGHPGIPTGALGAGEGAAGDRIQFSGWGFATANKELTREQRVSFLKSHNEQFWFAWGVVSNTDSGGPVVHLPTGEALGSVSNYCVPLPLNQAGGFEPGCTAFGPSIAGILADAEPRGFTAEIRTAAEGAPAPPAPASPAPAAPGSPPQSAPGPAPAVAPPPADRCAAARAGVHKAARALASARRALTRRRTPAARRRVRTARRKLDTARAALRRCG